MKRRTSNKEVKEHVVSLKLNGTLVRQIDAEAAVEEISRSAVIRRTLLARYRTTAHAV